jgi:hypothetical protein
VTGPCSADNALHVSCNARAWVCRGLPISSNENGGQYRNCLRLATRYGNEQNSLFFDPHNFLDLIFDGGKGVFGFIIVSFLIAIYASVMAVYDSLTPLSAECCKGSLSSYVNKENLASFFGSHYLFIQSISIQSLVGSLTIIVVFLVLSENQNVITNCIGRTLCSVLTYMALLLHNSLPNSSLCEQFLFDVCAKGD